MGQTLQAPIDRETLQLAIETLRALGATTVQIYTATRSGPINELFINSPDKSASVTLRADPNGGTFTVGVFTCDLELLETLLSAVPVAETRVSLVLNTADNFSVGSLRPPSGSVSIGIGFGDHILAFATTKAAEVKAVPS